MILPGFARERANGIVALQDAARTFPGDCSASLHLRPTELFFNLPVLLSLVMAF